VGSETWAAGRIMSTAFRRAGDIECDVFTMERQDARGLPLYYVRGFDENQRPVLDRGHGIPTDRAGWERYDVVIISDIDRRIFSNEQMEWVRQLVAERGGGFAMFGGNQGFDTGNYDQTIWEKLIPVDCLEFGFGHGWRGVKPQFPAAQRRHPILRLATDEATNNAILDCHPAFRGYHDIRRAKPGAVALAKVEDGEAPIIAVQEYGRGRTMAFLSDPAGGWADGGYEGFWGPGMLADFLGADAPEAARAIIDDASLAPNEFYNRFWVNSIRWLSEKSVRRQNRPLLARCETALGRPGEPLAISAELRAGASEEMANWSVGARLEGAGQTRVALQFDRQRREFTGEISVPADCAAGDLKVVVDAVSGDAAFTDAVTVPVVRMAREFERTAPDARLMADIARAGGGRLLEAASEAGEVFAKARQSAANARISYAQPLWDRAWFWALMLALLSLEWWLRRRGRSASSAAPSERPRESVAAVFFCAALLALSGNATAAESIPRVTRAAHVCLILGDPGDAGHRERFAKLRSQFERAFRQHFGIPGDRLTNFNADPGERKASTDQGDDVRKKLMAFVTDAAAKAQPDAATWFVFIGHGNATRTGANFNVPGPDVTEGDLRDALNAAPAAGPVVVLFPTAASGRMVRAMAGPNRLIFAATRPGDEDNEPELPAILADAIESPATDADHDGIVTVLELFQACVPAVRAAYERLGFMQKEMPVLDANGDGRATQRPSHEDAEAAARVGLKIVKP
ncbi:MAG: glutamine amidotransferase, partial [Chthoniobacteraceae bacterium]